jgi:hypothetical protein
MAEKKPRKKKSLKAKLENKVEKTSEESIKTPKLDEKEMYEFISNGKYPAMGEGKIWTVNGKTAMLFLERGFGKLKK